MNRCRTCKYWSVNEHGIGVGFCLNTYANRLLLNPERLVTCQDFGCVFYDKGECEAQVTSTTIQSNLLREFMQERFPVAPTKPRPTIDELEKILASEEKPKIVVNPDGSIETK